VIQRLLAAGMAAACLLVPGPGHAQAVTRQTTPNGLSFRHVLLPDEQTQALAFAWRDGSALAGKEALPSLAMALIMEGPRGMSRSAMFEELRDLQASASLGATLDIAQGTLAAPVAKFSTVVDLLARLLSDPALPADRLADIVRSRASARRQADANADVLARQLLLRLLAEDGPHRRQALGEPAAPEAVTVDDIARWRGSTLVRAALAVVAAGPMPAVQVGQEIDRLFSGLPDGGAPPRPAGPVLRAPGKLVVLERPVVQTAIAAGGPASLPYGQERTGATLALPALGGGASGRLWQAVREKLGAAYGISASFQSLGPEARTLLISAAVANDKAGEVVEAIRQEYARFLAEGITAQELDRLQRAAVASLRERRGRAGAVAGIVLSQALRGLPDDDLDTYEQRLRGYERATVNAEVRTTFPPPPLTMVVVAPSANGIAADCVIRSPAEFSRCE
jgi:zinc protease